VSNLVTINTAQQAVAVTVGSGGGVTVNWTRQ
jgi:hypothetical protein